MKWLWAFLIFLGVILNSCTKPTTHPTVDVFGHAGTSLHSDKTIYPANSLESITYALDVLDADGVEVDVQMTKDSVLVLYHNNYLGQTTNFDDCIGNYNYSQIKDVKLDYTNYKLVLLKDAIAVVESRNKQMYLDVKFYDHCNEKIVSISSLQFGVNNAVSQIDSNYLNKNVMIGMTSYTVLNLIDFPNKCYESTNINSGIEIGMNNNFKAILFFDDIMSVEGANQLNNTNLYWGIVGVKSKWEIDRVIDYQPKFIISDNIARTKKVTN